MAFGYRSGRILGSKKIVVDAKLQLNECLERSCKDFLREYKQLMAARRTKQPKNHRNFGSTFKQPEGKRAAGWYLDQVDMKGKRRR